MLAIKNPPIIKSGAALTVKALIDSGVKQIFGYPGASVLSLYNELAGTSEIQHCLCRHEQACVHAAEGYAKVSGNIGVVLVTSGPGVTNTVTGIADAFADSIPILIIAGAPSNVQGKVFQDVNFADMIKSSVKKVYIPSVSDNIYQVIKDAVNTALDGKKGPVFIQLSREVLDSKQEIQEQVILKNLNSKTCVPNINSIVDLINDAKSPLFIVGGGCINCFNKVTELVNKTQIPTVSTLMGIGNIASATPAYYGMIGVNGDELSNRLVSQADLIIAFGVAFSDRTTCKSDVFANGTPVININIEKYRFSNINVISEINYSCESVIDALLSQNLKKRTLLDKLSNHFNFTSLASKMSTHEVLEYINSYTEGLSPIIITDVGQHQMLAAKSFKFSKPRHFLTSGGMGTMGFGLPAACGVHFAEPKSCIINITGDGSFQMNIQELATVSEYNIPVKIFVMNNGYLGMIRQTQEKFFNGNYYQSKMANPDFIKLAEGYGIKGFSVNSIPQLKAVMPDIFNNNKPIIVNCITNEYENV